MIHNDTVLGAEEPKKERIFHCVFCDYTTSKTGNWNRHIKTPKHNARQMIHNDTQMIPNLEPTGHEGADKAEIKNKYQCKCGKTYKYHTGLSRHKKRVLV